MVFLSVLLFTVASFSHEEERAECLSFEETATLKGQAESAESHPPIRLVATIRSPPQRVSTDSLKFRVYRSDAQIGPYALIDSVTVTLAPGETLFTYSDTTVKCAMVYWYMIAMVDDAGFEAPAGPDSGTPHNLPPCPSPPRPPYSLVVGDTPDDEGGSVTLTWIESPDDSVVANYYIYQSRMSGRGFQCIDSVSAGVTTYVDSLVVNGDTVYYMVRAHNGLNGSTSNEAWGVSMGNLAPRPPVGVTARPEANGIRISWISNSEADLRGYRVYRSARRSAHYVLISGRIIRDTTYLDTDISHLNTYYYVVTALDAHYESSHSNEVRIQLRP